MYTNVRIADSVVTNEDYARRAAELGHGIISTMEHGWQGRYIEGYELAQQYNLKFVFGTEAYWVKDREKEYSDESGKSSKDSSNCHICIFARNENGRQAINDILSEANITGYYIRPRIDLSLIFSLPPQDVIVTTACVAYWKYDDVDDITKQFYDYFGKNFYLEVQYHNTELQRNINRHILELSERLQIPLIMGCDSHYIYEDQAWERTDFLASKGIEYPDEEGWYMDYPDGATAYKRFADQCVLSHEQILEAMNNTNVFLEVEEYDCPIFNHEVKLPTIYPELTQDERDKKFTDLVWQLWEEQKYEVPQSQWSHYVSEIMNEVETVVVSHTADYFLLDYEIVKLAKARGGELTPTGRGCFTEEALVHTKTGLKRICDVDIGDEVIDKNGHWKKVINTATYDIEEELIQIKHICGTDTHYPIKCTLDHKIFIHRGDKNQWIAAKDIKPGDYVCVPKTDVNDCRSEEYIDLAKYNYDNFKYDDHYIYEVNANLNYYPYSPTEVAGLTHITPLKLEQAVWINNHLELEDSYKKRVEAVVPFRSFEEWVLYVQERRTTKINRYIKNDYLWGEFIGLLYGDGWHRADGNELGLAINPTTKKDTINKEVFVIASKRLGIPYNYKSADNKKLAQMYMRSRILKHYIETELFISKKGSHKQFNPRFFNEDISVQRGILDGLFQSDGSDTEGRKSFDNTSLSLINAYKILALNVRDGIYSLNVRPAHQDRGYNCKEAYKLRRPGALLTTPKLKERGKEDDYYWYLPVKSTCLLPKQKTKVYDLEVEGTHSFLINNMIVHNSAVSYYINKLLGFTKVDRIAAKVKMYPERFMSAVRILQTKSLPDIDMNVSAPEIFWQAQKDIIGENHAYQMIAYGTMAPLAAWKMYAKASGIDFDTANEVSQQIQKWQRAVKHADEDEKDDIDVFDYIEPQYHEVYQRSERYRGIVASWSIHPCASVVYSGDIRREIGLTYVKSSTSKEGILCAVIDGKWAEEYKFLKNDWLTVQVVKLMYRLYRRIGMEVPSVEQLLRMCSEDNGEAWSIYRKKCTLGINQVEQPGTSARVGAYAPTNISELCAFVAAIRPGFKSMYKIFESRQPFSYNIPSFDALIQTEEMPNSFVLYQEMAMAALNYAGIDMSECYAVIKNIAKKRVAKVVAYKDQFLSGFAQKIMVAENKPQEEADRLAHQVWQILEDSSRYSFNASHSYCVSLDGLYCAWVKAHYPLEFYEVYMQIQDEKSKKDKIKQAQLEAEQYFNISFPPYRYGQDNTHIAADPEHNSITNSLKSIKGFNQSTSEILLECSQKMPFQYFIGLLLYLKQHHRVTPTRIIPLIKIGYFQDFGNIPTLLSITEAFEFLKEGEAKKVAKDKLEGQMCAAVIMKLCSDLKKDGTPAKSYTLPEDIIDRDDLFKAIEDHIRQMDLPDISFKEKINYQLEVLGYMDLTTNKKEDIRKLAVMSVFPLRSKNSKSIWAYVLDVKSLGTGKTCSLTVNKSVFEQCPLVTADVIYADKLYKTPKGYWYLDKYWKLEGDKI